MSAASDYAVRALEMLGERESTRWERLRDKLGEIVANWALVHIATFEYQAAIYALVQSGRERALAKDA